MKKINTLLMIVLFTISISCGNKDKSKGLEGLEGLKPANQTETGVSSNYLDSISSIDERMERLMSQLDDKREQISFLTQKKDSIMRAAEQIRLSLEQVKSKKINPGIEGVNIKLDELKGQKENLVELQNLQKQEVDLAEKKIKIQLEEKAVYEAQHKALFDKGAPPADFKKVDSLLANIDLNLNTQAVKVKELKRSIADIDEKVASIDQNRNSLSIKIRNNYTAQRIYEEYSEEEMARLKEQLGNVEEQLGLLLGEQDDLNSRLSISSGNKNYMQLKQDELDAEKLRAAQEEQELLLQQQLDKEKKDARRAKILRGFIWLMVIGLAVYGLYYIGKKQKERKSKK